MRYTAILILAFATAAGAQSGNWSAVKPGANTKPVTEWKQRLIIAVCKEGEKRANNSWYEDASGNWVPEYPPRICKAGKWVEDAEQEAKDEADVKRVEAEAEAKQKRRTELWNALRIRVVTDAEMAEILANGVEIVPPISAMSADGYYTNSVFSQVTSRESLLIEALYYQSMMRLNAGKACITTKEK